LLGLAGVAAILLGIAGQRWYQAELQQAQREIRGGEVRSARARLSRLAKLGQGGAETDYWLGACEEAEGHIDAALATWARIPHGSTAPSRPWPRRKDPRSEAARPNQWLPGT
jgi:hypothetical protein